MTQDEIINKFLGVPFKHQGRDMEGLDCWGLIVLVYRDLGVKLIDLDKYPPSFEWDGRNYFAENAHKQWEEVNCPEYLDVVLFNGPNDVINHAGIYMRDGHVLHTCRVGTVLVPLNRIDKKIAGFYRLKT